MEAGFQKGASDNLPKVHAGMVADFFANNSQFVSAEVQNVKATRATEHIYGDNAIGYVQVKKDAVRTTVKARITPEHKIRKTSYKLEAVINTRENRVETCVCQNCAAAAGGCKHAVAFLMWLHRRSEEPAVTSVVSYWKKSALANVGQENLDCESIFGKEVPALPPREDVYLHETIIEFPDASGGVFDIIKEPGEDVSFSLFHLMMSFVEKTTRGQDSVEDFIKFCQEAISYDLCKDVEYQTRQQSKCSLWYEMRFGRITASKLHEVSGCHTSSGVLVDSIFGKAKVPETPAIKRGKRLEPFVLNEVAKLKKLKIKSAGVFIDPKYPIFAASPDGITDDFCIEIKCPSNIDTVKNYVRDGRVQKKPFFQLQLQMLLSRKTRGLFCVASPDFENNSAVEIIEVGLEEDELAAVMQKAETFWKSAIYPSLKTCCIVD